MKKLDNLRFADTGASLYDLATSYVVACPQCQGRAVITSDSSPNTFRLRCTSCFHVETPAHWYGAATAFVSVKCRECYHPLRRSAPWKGTWKKLAMKCDKCGDQCEYDAHITYHSLHQGRMTDPVFGLDLWLQREFRDELFWAYNYEHLALLRQFVEAKLRERGISPRNTIKKNSSMVSRLPVFIKKAAHRADLLKMISKMQQA